MKKPKKVVKQININPEDKIILKLSNKWEFLGYMFAYKLSKFIMSIVIVVLLIIILKLSGFNFSNIPKILKGMGL